MAQITYDEVNLMLRLYDLRREPRLRQARAWFTDNFHPTSPEDMIEKYPQGSEENTYIRMVISYWEMVASIVNRGLINDELFFESNGEIWVVWDRMRTIVPTWRAAFKNPHLFQNIEETCKRLEAWREKRQAFGKGELSPAAARPWSWRRNAPRPARKIWATPASRKASSAHRYATSAPRRSPVIGAAVTCSVPAATACFDLIVSPLVWAGA